MKPFALPALSALLIALATLAAPTPADGQVPTLDRVDSLMTAGRYENARSILEQWWSARDEFDVPGSDKARALMLRAQLARDPEDAEPDYLAVVLGYPTSDQAPEALLRLGQGLLATGDATRAAAYLERLVADYPGRPQRTEALLWLARANTTARQPAAACAAARQGLQDVQDPDLRAMLQVETGASCAVRTDAPPTTDRETDADARTADPTNTGADPANTGADPAGADADADGDYAVQTGAFQHRRSADDLLERLRDADYSPRLVRLPGNELIRVRVGRFQDPEEARSLVARLQAQGFDAFLVNDAGREREP